MNVNFIFSSPSEQPLTPRSLLLLLFFDPSCCLGFDVLKSLSSITFFFYLKRKQTKTPPCFWVLFPFCKRHCVAWRLMSDRGRRHRLLLTSACNRRFNTGGRPFPQAVKRDTQNQLWPKRHVKNGPIPILKDVSKPDLHHGASRFP